MAKYRKKPVVIEAVQFDPAKEPYPEDVYTIDGDDDTSYIDTLEGPLRVSPGDWIITGVKGEKCPCRDDIFRQTYEPVDAPAAVSEEVQS